MRAFSRSLQFLRTLRCWSTTDLVGGSSPYGTQMTAVHREWALQCSPDGGPNPTFYIETAVRFGSAHGGIATSSHSGFQQVFVARKPSGPADRRPRGGGAAPVAGTQLTIRKLQTFSGTSSAVRD